MKIKYAIVVLLTVFLVGCGGGTTDSDGNGNALVRFTILLSAGCADNFNNSDIIFDDRFIANLIPGNSTTFNTTRGTHRLEARADNGATLGPLTVVVDFDGQTHTLTCNS